MLSSISCIQIELIELGVDSAIIDSSIAIIRPMLTAEVVAVERSHIAVVVDITAEVGVL